MMSKTWVNKCIYLFKSLAFEYEQRSEIERDLWEKSQLKTSLEQNCLAILFGNFRLHKSIFIKFFFLLLRLIVERQKTLCCFPSSRKHNLNFTHFVLNQSVSDTCEHSEKFLNFLNNAATSGKSRIFLFFLHFSQKSTLIVFASLSFHGQWCEIYSLVSSSFGLFFLLSFVSSLTDRMKYLFSNVLETFYMWKVSVFYAFQDRICPFRR